MNLTIDQALEQAIDAHKANRLQDAENLYRAILQLQPHHPDANHNLGILVMMVGKHEDALQYLEAALKTNRHHVQFWASYLNGLAAAGRLVDAQKVLVEAKAIGLTEEVITQLDPNLIAKITCAGNQPLLTNAGKHLHTSKAPKEKSHSKRSDRKAIPTQVELSTLITCYNQGRFDVVEKLASELTAKFPNHPFAWKVLGATFAQNGEPEKALEPIRRSIRLIPKDAVGHNNMGATLNQLGRSAEALDSCQQAIKLDPKYAEAYSNLGNSKKALGLLDEAELSYRKALTLKPEFPEAYNNLGNVLKIRGHLIEAEKCYLEAIRLKPDYAEAFNNLGNILRDESRFTEAENCYRQAIQLKPGYSDAWFNLAMLFHDTGNFKAALDFALTAHKLSPNPKSKNLVSQCLCSFDISHYSISLAKLAILALEETWESPAKVTTVSQKLILLHPKFKEFLGQLSDDSRQFNLNAFLSFLYSESVFSHLLNSTLQRAPLSCIPLERFATKLRQYFLVLASSSSGLDTLDHQALGLLSMLAQQCYINEYVYASSDRELKAIANLRLEITKKLRTQSPIREDLILILACYEPLYSSTEHLTLMKLSSSRVLEDVLEQQLREPLAELALKATIPSITEIKDVTSLQVQNQYEQNPYPRWIRLPRKEPDKRFNEMLRALFPRADFNLLPSDLHLSILIAGCGTGQHAIQVATSIKHDSMLAVDLSMSSLAYAKRKAGEDGIKTIEFAQADILQLGKIGRTFDVIESGGVLHHMSDPFFAWDALAAMLRPNGCMKIGLYSSIARRHIVKLRDIIAAERIESTHSGIVAFRENFFKNFKTEDYGWVASSSDFYSTSACRDLLFHVHEHRMDLLTIQEYLHRRGLKFLGFEIDQTVILSYQRRFPDDSAACNLQQWHLFEQENPDTFKGMYQFWIQKP